MLPPRAYVFIGLNVIRILSLISLILVFASSIVTMVHDVKSVNQFNEEGGDFNKGTIYNSTSSQHQHVDYIPGSTVPCQPLGAAWAVVNRLLIVFQVLVLILSELGWPSKFFNTYFPILGDNFGLGPLGVIQCLIGAAILSHRIDTFAIVSAFFLFSLGCTNILLGLIFRGRGRERRCIFAWRERARDVLPRVNVAGHQVDVVGVAEKAGGFVRGHMARQDTGMSGTTLGSLRAGVAEKAKAEFGFGQGGERRAMQGGHFLARPVESHPKYSMPSPHTQ